MGYTTCKDICPAIVANMMWVEKHLPPGRPERVRFAFFSFDSEADTPERLRLYAESHGLDLAAGRCSAADDDAVRELAAALGVGYRPNDQDGFDHAAVISLLDEKARSCSSSAGRRRARTNCWPRCAAWRATKTLHRATSRPVAWISRPLTRSGRQSA